MYIIINKKNEINQQLQKIFKQNYINNIEYNHEYQYSVVIGLDYWFTMCDDNDNIIACCSVIRETPNIYEINDVFVEEKYRGNNYSCLLIMNVLHYFEENFENITIKIVSYLNTAAYNSYIKIFDKPYRCDAKFAYFSHYIS